MTKKNSKLLDIFASYLHPGCPWVEGGWKWPTEHDIKGSGYNYETLWVLETQNLSKIGTLGSNLSLFERFWSIAPLKSHSSTIVLYGSFPPMAPLEVNSYWFGKNESKRPVWYTEWSLLLPSWLKSLPRHTLWDMKLCCNVGTFVWIQIMIRFIHETLSLIYRKKSLDS